MPISRGMKLTATNGKEMRALDVFSEAFRYLRDSFLQCIEKKYFLNLQDTDVQWVITVSDVWDDAAKYFIREAANLVRFCFTTSYRISIRLIQLK